MADFMSHLLSLPFVSKKMGDFEVCTAGMKRDLRRVMKETDGWDIPITSELRSTWVKNLWTLEKMKGMNDSICRSTCLYI